MRSYLLLYLLLVACSKPEFEDKSLISSTDLKVKSIRTYYIDIYGDQLRRDGEIIGEALFGSDGTLMNIKTTHSRKTKFQSNAYWIERYEGIPVNRLLWVLDGGIYGQQWRNVTQFLTGGANYPMELGSKKANEVVKAEEMYKSLGGEYNYQIDNPDRPTLIETFSKQPMTGDVKEMSSWVTQQFSYDEAGRIINLDVSTTHDLDGWPASNYVESFQYDTSGQISNYTHEDVNVSISRSAKGLVDLIEITKKGKLQRWYTFEYLDNSLRQSSQAFNSNNEHEFTVEYVYEFYD